MYLKSSLADQCAVATDTIQTLCQFENGFYNMLKNKS